MSGGLPDLDGPVTIMFSDIEGSTALRTTLGDADTDALFKQHDEIIRSQIESCRGHDQKAALGDGFLAVFASTRRAVACAIGIQRALDAFNRGRSSAPMQVRIGLNTGEVAEQDGQLSGEAVHAAARVCAQAEGGQILVSDVTRQLAGTIPDVSFRDTGEHQLKGFPQPWRLWDVVWVRETSAVPQQVFVGREAELQALRSRLSDTLDGRGGLVLVGGEPGVGKTTLVKQLIVEAEKRGALCVFGRCYESEGAVPYSPFVEMLEQGLALMPPDIVREDLGEDAPEVARMVPELRRRFPDIGEPLDLPPEQQRRYFFNAVGSFIERAQARFPLVLIMDDVHWADEPTLLLIEHMAELMKDMRVLGIGTYRDVELDVSRPLAATMERLIRTRAADRIPLHRFDEAMTKQMVGALAGKEAPDDLVRVIYEETEGNPFFVEEVFRHLVEEGKVFDESGSFRADVHVEELDVPESVRLVVGRRLERLGPQALKVLAAGAVVGRGFPFALLEAIGGVDAGELLDIVDEAEAAKVIVPEEIGGEAHYTFAHELIRQTLLGTVSLPRRQRLHLAVADAMERLDPGAAEMRPSEIANHLLQAGVAADPERTISLLERTADRAYDGAAFEEAARATDAALQLVSDDDVTRRAALKERLGWTLRALGRFEESIRTWDEVVEVYRGQGEAERAAHLCREVGFQLGWLGRLEDVFTALQRGLGIVGEMRTSVRSRLLSSTGMFVAAALQMEAAEPYFTEALEIAGEFQDDVAFGEALFGRSAALFVNFRAREGAEVGRAAVEHLERAGDPWTVCDAKGWLALCIAFSGRPDEGLIVARECWDQAARIGQIGAQILASRTLAFEPAGAGDLDMYERFARRDLELCESIRSPWMAQSYAWVGMAAELRGRIDEALALHDKAVPLEPESAFTGFTAGQRILNRAYATSREEFIDLVAEAESLVVGRTDPIQIGAAAARLCTCIGAAMLGLPEIADRYYDRAVTQAEAAPVASFGSLLSERGAGMAASCTERWDEAEVHFERALAHARDLPLKLDEPQVKHWYGKMLIDSGRDRERGRRLVGEAIRDYRRMGMPVLLSMAEELLQRV